MSSKNLSEIITREDLLKTAQHLRNYLPRSINIINTLLVNAHSRTPNDWRFYIDHTTTNEEACIILIVPWNEKQKQQRIYFFCSPGLNWKLKDNLEELLDWSKTTKFCVTDEVQVDMVRSLCQENGNLDFEIPVWIFSLWPNNSLPAIIKRDEVSVRPVSPQFSKLIDSFWKFSGEGTEDMIRKLCQEEKVFGAFYGEDNEPAAWMFQHNTGAFGNLYTREEFRGRGFAREVVVALTKDAASRGLEPNVHIEEYNKVSMELFTKLGFTKHNKATWLQFSNKT